MDRVLPMDSGENNSGKFPLLMEDLNTTGVAGEPDGLFYDRLDAFCRAEIKAFAERERRSLEEVGTISSQVFYSTDALLD